MVAAAADEATFRYLQDSSGSAALEDEVEPVDSTPTSSAAAATVTSMLLAAAVAAMQ